MRIKPNLCNAKIIKVNQGIPLKMMKYLSPEARKHLEKEGLKEMGSANVSIGEWFVLKDCIFDKYYKFITEGTRKEISLYRLVGGCNHLLVFEKPGCEKSEDYDSLDASQILDLPQDYEEALSILTENFIGKKLRVVARSADKSDPYENRYYLFAIEE